MPGEYDTLIIIIGAWFILGPFGIGVSLISPIPSARLIQVTEIKDDIILMITNMKNKNDCKLHNLYLPDHYMKILEENRSIFRIIHEIETSCNITIDTYEPGKYKIISKDSCRVNTK